MICQTCLIKINVNSSLCPVGFYGQYEQTVIDDILFGQLTEKLEKMWTSINVQFTPNHNRKH